MGFQRAWSLGCFLLGDGFPSTHCFDSVLNMCVHDMLCLFLRPSDRHLNSLFSDRNSKVCNGLLHRTLLNPVLRESLGGLCQFLHNGQNWCVNDLLHIPLLDSILGASARLDLWVLNDFLENIQLWDLNCLFRDLFPWNLHNRVINHLVNTLQL